MSVAATIQSLFTPSRPVPEPEPLQLDLNRRWDAQDLYVELTRRVTAATQIFNAAQAAYTRSENLTEPNRQVWQRAEVGELEFLQALRDRQAIKDHYLSAKLVWADLLAKQTALGTRIRTTMFQRRCASPVRRELVRAVDTLLDPIVEVNTVLFDYEQNTKMLCGCEFAQDSQLYLREMLDPEQTGRPSQWRSFCKQEGM